MALHWVYGCQVADGTFEFSDTETGCEGVTITGCLVESGEHEGKVEITHDYPEECSVDEYACFYDATGEWRFQADDGCCECEDCPCTECVGNCGPVSFYIEYYEEDVLVDETAVTCETEENCYWTGQWTDKYVGLLAALEFTGGEWQVWLGSRGGAPCGGTIGSSTFVCETGGTIIRDCANPLEETKFIITVI